MQKKIHRFLISTPLSGTQTVIDEPSFVHHVRDVLRLTEGEQVRLFTDGGPEYVLRITSIEKHAVSLETEREITSTNLPRHIIAVVSIVKRDLFELVVQKLTELGVSEIVPLLAARTVKQSVRIDRLQVISDEALEQCGGTARVLIHEPMSLTKALTTFPFESIVFDTGDEKPLSQKDASKIVYYIGPEGGWSDEERELFNTHHARTASLGPRILRAETAAIIAADRLLWN